MIVFDASTIVGAALKAGSVPEQALLHASETDTIALSHPVEAEIAEVLARPKFARAIARGRRALILGTLRGAASWFEPTEVVTDCRDWKDNKYLELALASGAPTVISSDQDLLVLDPWRRIRVMFPADYLAGI